MDTQHDDHRTAAESNDAPEKTSGDNGIGKLAGKGAGRSADRACDAVPERPSGKSHAKPVADLAFVGLGVSNATALQHLLKQIIEQPPAASVNITLIERHEVHYTGVAYGPRSGPNSLIISTLEDFIDEPERSAFILWLKANESWLLSSFRERGGDLSAQWFDSFQQADEKTLASKICVPRSFFGYFLREQINRLIDTASALGLVKITSITAEVRDIQKKSHSFSLKLSTHRQRVHARKVMLGIGPPAHRMLARADSVADSSHIIDDAYQANIGVLCRSLGRELVKPGTGKQQRASLNVLMVGANASAIEAAYLLFDQKELRRLIKQIVVLSPSGSFPDRRPEARSREQLGYRPACLEELATCGSITAREIYLAFMADLNQWKSMNVEGVYPVVSLGKEVVNCVQRLSRAQKKRFIHRYGVLIGKYQRRSGDEYLDFASEAMQRDRLMHVKGRFSEVVAHDETGYQASIKTATDTAAEVMKDRFQMIINCMGPTSLHDAQGPLITQLLRRGLCKVNESGRGFKVRDDYSAIDGLIVTGPLISGNVIAGQAVWHVEHCGRLTAIGKVLGKRLHGELTGADAGVVAA